MVLRTYVVAWDFGRIITVTVLVVTVTGSNMPDFRVRLT